MPIGEGRPATEWSKALNDRDYFAAAAMSGLIARAGQMPWDCAADCYAWADAMIRERERNGDGQTIDGIETISRPLAGEASPSGSGGASERQSPAGDRNGGEPLDAGAATSHHAAGGRGRNTHEPVAWAVVQSECWSVYLTRLDANRAATHGLGELVALYSQPQPTLTDEEREAIAGAVSAEHGRGAWQWAATLRGLLERTK
jgi:hypothetical protein